MDNNRVTTQDTWRNYWSNRQYLIKISDKYCFHDVIRNVTKQLPHGGSCIEIGGFPGYFSIYFKKYCRLNPTLLDFYFDERIFNEVIEFNGFHKSDIQCIRDDVFTHMPTEHYDLVASFGLIEHFIDLKKILTAHIKYMKPDAILLIGLPNFKGINGLLQKYFDPANLSIHNIDVMNLKSIKDSLSELGLSQIEVSYYPSTQVWLEHLDQRGVLIGLLVRIINKLMPLLGLLFGKKNKILSNSIIAIARANQQDGALGINTGNNLCK